MAPLLAKCSRDSGKSLDSNHHNKVTNPNVYSNTDIDNLSTPCRSRAVQQRYFFQAHAVSRTPPSETGDRPLVQDETIQYIRTSFLVQ